jgi:hypothetical protein
MWSPSGVARRFRGTNPPRFATVFGRVPHGWKYTLMTYPSPYLNSAFGVYLTNCAVKREAGAGL